MMHSVSFTTNFFAPFNGIVKTVRVKTPDLPQGTGQLQILVLRQLTQRNEDNPGTPNNFCCFLQKYGPTFAPTRNAINTIQNANLGMVADEFPAEGDYHTVAKADFLALSMLGSDVPLPIASDPGGFLSAYVPAPSPGNPSEGGSVFGRLGNAPDFMVLMNADIEPLGSGGGGPGGGGGGTTGGGGTSGGGGGASPTPDTLPQAPIAATPVSPVTPTRTVQFEIGGARLAGTTASLPLSCRLATTCAGTLRLQDQAPPAVAFAASRKTKLLGAARFSIPVGETLAVKVHLNAAGRKLVRRKRKLVAYAAATVAGQVTSTKVTFRALRKRSSHG
jgi:hypothetical protein